MLVSLLDTFSSETLKFQWRRNHITIRTRDWEIITWKFDWLLLKIANNSLFVQVLRLWCLKLFRIGSRTKLVLFKLIDWYCWEFFSGIIYCIIVMYVIFMSFTFFVSSKLNFRSQKIDFKKNEYFNKIYLKGTRLLYTLAYYLNLWQYC